LNDFLRRFDLYLNDEMLSKTRNIIHINDTYMAVNVLNALILIYMMLLY